MRSYLYVPGDRPDRFDKAAAAGADAVILDLEDAVPIANKDAARDHVVAWLRAHPGARAVVRVNNGDRLEPDLRAVVDAGARTVSLPKASLDDLARLEAIAGVDLIALVETAAGVLDARAIAAHPRVVRLAIGEADLGAELGATDGFETARGIVVLASAAAGIEPPVAPVHLDVRHLDGLRDSTRALRARGFGARAAIHPAQVPVINEVFTPTASEAEEARRLVRRFEEAGGSVFTDDDGRMVDEAVVRAARRTLSLAERDV